MTHFFLTCGLGDYEASARSCDVPLSRRSMSLRIRAFVWGLSPPFFFFLSVVVLNFADVIFILCLRDLLFSHLRYLYILPRPRPHA